MKKTTQLNRIGHKSMKLLATMAKNPDTKKRLQSKKVAGRKFQAIVEKQRMHNLINRNDGVDGERKVSGFRGLLPQIVAAKRAEDLLEKAIEEKRKTDDLEMKFMTVDVHHENSEDSGDHYAEVHRQDTKGGDTNAATTIKSRSPANVRVENETNYDDELDSENGYDDVDNKLSVPKVEGDQWPEEDHYAAVSKDIDILF